MQEEIKILDYNNKVISVVLHNINSSDKELECAINNKRRNILSKIRRVCYKE